MASLIKSQPWPPEPWFMQIVGTQPRMFDAKGRDITNDPRAHERMIACVNGFKGVWLAESFVEEATATARRAEALRKEAWHRAETLEAALVGGVAA